jgi:DNA-binding IclR family transcriptional regulator
MSRSSERCLELLAAATQAPAGSSLTQLARRTGIDTSTAARLLDQLEQTSWLERDATDKTYYMGPLFVRLAARALERSDVRAIAAPQLRALRDASQETVTLHVRAGAQRVCIDGVESPHPIRRAALLGEVVPLHEGVTGRAMLAFLSEREAAPTIESAIAAGISAAHLRRALTTIRRNGYACGVGERTPGVGVLAVPVHDADGVTAAVCIGGPAQRWSVRRIHAFAPAALETAAAISHALGGGQR